MKRFLSGLIVLFILSFGSIANAGVKGTVVFARNDVAVIQTEQFGNYTILTSCFGICQKMIKFLGNLILLVLMIFIILLRMALSMVGLIHIGYLNNRL